jgi:proteasome lid subunit RPN8/RPN11
LFLSLDALLDMFGHGEIEPNREVGGILLGELAQGPRGGFTRVADIIPALSPEAGLTHITFTHDTWDQIHGMLEERPDDLHIVGWYHTHPGFGPFLSAHDHFIQQHFFSDPLHVAVVLDPVRHSLRVFGWDEQEIRRAGGCWVWTASGRREELLASLQRVEYVPD